MNRDNVEALIGKRILFASMPAEGHVNPLTGLAKHLQQIGCDVRWYTGMSYSEKIAKLGIPFYPYVNAMDFTGDNLAELIPEREKINNKIKKLVFDLIHVFVKQAPKFVADMKEIRKEFPFDLVIAECTFTAIPLVKKVFGVPVVGVGIAPLMENSRDLPPTGLGMTPSYTTFGKLRQAFLRYITNRVLFRRANKVTHEILGKFGVDWGHTFIFDISVKASDLYLQSGTPGFEYHRSDMSRNVRFIGSLLPYSSKKSASWYDPRLSQFNNVILVTQGTVEGDVEKLLVPTLEAFKGTDVLVVCTTGGSMTEELRQRFPQRNIIIEDFIPFDQVMPYANAYITNGGYGGVMLGIQNALPMVVAGVHEGKNEICARIGYFKLGINLRTEKPKPAQIRKATQRILSDTTYRTNAEKLSQEFSRYNPGELCARYVSALLTKPVDARPAVIVSDAAA